MDRSAVASARGLFSGAASELRAFARERSRHRPAAPANGLVLDVGSGQSPNARADVIVDKYLVDSFERGAGEAFEFTKPVVVADAQALPFADGTFTYVIASHVLEHAPDPGVMATELQRVGRAGFVQVPSRDSELVFSWPFHPWLIDLDGETLVFSPKPSGDVPGGPTAHAAFGESLLVRLGWQAHRSRWHHSVHWSGSLAVRTEGGPVLHNQAEVDLPGTVELLERLGASGGLAPMSASVRASLRCPACLQSLTTEKNLIICDGCQRAYPIVSGVPVLLEIAALNSPLPNSGLSSTGSVGGSRPSE